MSSCVCQLLLNSRNGCGCGSLVTPFSTVHRRKQPYRTPSVGVGGGQKHCRLKRTRPVERHQGARQQYLAHSLNRSINTTATIAAAEVRPAHEPTRPHQPQPTASAHHHSLTMPQLASAVARRRHHPHPLAPVASPSWASSAATLSLLSDSPPLSAFAPRVIGFADPSRTPTRRSPACTRGPNGV